MYNLQVEEGKMENEVIAMVDEKLESEMNYGVCEYCGRFNLGMPSKCQYCKKALVKKPIVSPTEGI